MHLRWMSLLAALPRPYTVHSWTFSPVPCYCKVVVLHRFFTQTVLSFDDRNLSSTYTVRFITFSNKVPSDDFQQQPIRFLTVQCTGFLVIQECKISSHYLQPKWLHVLCAANQTQPGHFEFSVDATSTHMKTSLIWDLQARADLCMYSIGQIGSTCADGFMDTLDSYHFFIRTLAGINSSYYRKIQNILSHKPSRLQLQRILRKSF